MPEENKKWTVILIGPPGSGKGTQADLLAEKFGLFHLESSKIIEEKLKKADPDDWVLQNEKRLWESGTLNTPELVLQWIQEKIKEIVTRTLDNPKTIKIRYQEYLKRTIPLIDILKYKNYRITKVNGEQPIEEVHNNILNYLDV